MVRRRFRPWPQSTKNKLNPKGGIVAATESSSSAPYGGEGGGSPVTPPTTDPHVIVTEVAAHLRNGGDESRIHAWLRNCFRVARRQGRREAHRRAGAGKNVW